jgi:glycerophosphoryl diester phosphodiesterase family protein
MTQPPAGEQEPPGWQVPGGDAEGAGAGWGVQEPPPQQPGWGTPPGQGQPGWDQGQPGWGQGQPGWGQPSWGGGQQQPWTPPVQAPAGIIPLRPLGVVELLDAAFHAVRSNPRSMIGVSAAVVAGVTLLSLVPQAFVLHSLGSAALGSAAVGTELSTGEELDVVSSALEAQLFPVVLTFFAVTVLNALLIVPVSAAVLGRRTSPGEMWQRAKGRLLPAVGLALLTGLALTGVVVAVLLPGIVVLVAGQTALGVLLLLAGIVAAIVLAVLLAVRWSLAAPALVLEKATVTTAMRRSWRLTGRSFWRVLGILLLTGIIVSIGQAAISFPLSALSSLPGAGQDNPYENLGTVFTQLLITGVGSIVAGAVFYPFSAASSALLYIDLRMRREGLDVRLAQAVAQGGPMR